MIPYCNFATATEQPDRLEMLYWRLADARLVWLRLRAAANASMEPAAIRRENAAFRSVARVESKMAAILRPNGEGR